MKKNALILALALLVALPVFGLAAELATVPAGETQAAQPYGFTDADEDGICDVCGNVPGTNAEGPNFTDADSDGVCDHYGTGLQGQGQGQGGMQRGQGRGGLGASKGRSFVDADGDGACDNLGTNLQGQARQGRGGGRGRR